MLNKRDLLTGIKILSTVYENNKVYAFASNVSFYGDGTGMYLQLPVAQSATTNSLVSFKLIDGDMGEFDFPVNFELFQKSIASIKGDDIDLVVDTKNNVIVIKGGGISHTLEISTYKIPTDLRKRARSCTLSPSLVVDSDKLAYGLNSVANDIKEGAVVKHGLEGLYLTGNKIVLTDGMKISCTTIPSETNHPLYLPRKLYKFYKEVAEDCDLIELTKQGDLLYNVCGRTDAYFEEWYGADTYPIGSVEKFLDQPTKQTVYNTYAFLDGLNALSKFTPTIKISANELRSLDDLHVVTGKFFSEEVDIWVNVDNLPKSLFSADWDSIGIIGKHDSLIFKNSTTTKVILPTTKGG